MLAILKNPLPATLIGLLAPLTWGLSYPLVRLIAENFGMAQGQCLLYSVAAVLLFITVGLPDFKKLSWKFWVFAMGSANMCSITFCIGVYLSAGGRQTMEAAMVNYLWPALTIIFAGIFNGMKLKWTIVPGTLLALFGVYWIISAGSPDPALFMHHIAENPLCFFFAFLGAVFWAAYSSATRAWGNNQNASTLVFIFDAVIFAVFWAAGFGAAPAASAAGASGFTLAGTSALLGGGFAMGMAYAAWTHGITYGKIQFLAIASYFTPVLSCLFGILLLNAGLDTSFWFGVGVLICGSLLSWQASRSN